MELIDSLNSLIIDKNELKNCTKSINSCLHKTLESCFDESDDFKIKSNKHLAIESVLDFLHDELNTGHWSDVPLEIRRAFTGASYIKAIIVLQSSDALNDSVLQEGLKTIDMGLLLGAPLELNPDLLTNAASLISKQLNTSTVQKNMVKSGEKRKRDHKTSDKFKNLKGSFVDSLSCPSLETFNKYFSSKMPVKLKDCISHWPALTKWVNLDYLLKIAGDRTVPVEIGSHYADENWRQKLMTVKDFIKNYFLEDSPDLGYLAQHNLFDQIPELRNDIHVPEYCCLSDLDENDDPDINAWFGPAGTVSPLHHDPKNNILVQVFGSKQLVLYSPENTEYLYPHESTLLFNTAQVDPFEPDLTEFPEFEKATCYKCLLETGEMLYIPPKWWHHVTALDKSFSVSFWWN